MTQRGTKGSPNVIEHHLLLSRYPGEYVVAATADVYEPTNDLGTQLTT